MFSGCWDDPDRGRHYSCQVHDGQLQGQDDLGALDVLTICVRCISNVISLCFICISVCLICISRCFIYMVHLGVSYIWWVNLGGRHCWGRDVQLLPDVLGWWTGEAQQWTVWDLIFLFFSTKFFFILWCLGVSVWAHLSTLGAEFGRLEVKFHIQYSLFSPIFSFTKYIFSADFFYELTQFSFQVVFLTSLMLKPPP